MEYGLVAVWLVLYLALLAAGSVLTAALFPDFGDRGAGVAVPLSAAVVWLVGYWVGHVSLAAAPWIGLLVLVASVVAVGYLRDVDPDWTIVGETALVFTVAFLFLVVVRAFDPAVHPHGGEKFLDFGLLKSLGRASSLPPEDMWFAGEPVRYYYGGHLLASLFARLTGTAPQYAYNLALAGFYAMLVTAAYGLAGSVAAHRSGPRRVGGLFGAFFVGFAANLATAGKVVLLALPNGVAGPLAGAVGFRMDGLARSANAFTDPWWYFGASRIIDGTINEFPLFAWLNGDLHAHMTSTPFMLLVAALFFAYFRTAETAVARRRLLVFGLVPPVGGLLAVVNTWSFPTVGGLALLTLTFAPVDPTSLLPQDIARRLRGLPGELRRLGVAAAGAVAVVGLGLLWSLPFWLGTASGRAVGLFPDRSPLGGLVVVHGAFLLVFGLYLLRHSLPRVRDPGRAAVLVGLVVVVGLLTRAPAVSLFAPLIGVGWVLLRGTAVGLPGGGGGGGTQTTTADGGATDGGTVAMRGRLPRPGFEVVLLVAGAGLALLVEFVFVQEQAGPGRMNTVFKTYAQVWIIWSVAAGVALTHLLTRHRSSLALSGGRWKPALRVVAALLVVSTSVYGVLALTTHVTVPNATSTDELTLDATRFVEVRHAEEAPAIRWLDRNVAGTPTIVTAPGGYRWSPSAGKGSNAPSSLTGLPTVVGWFHEIGYRGRESYQRRVADVRRIYTGSATTQAELLAEYDVQYVYVGPAERAKYDDPTFTDMQGVTVARQWESVTIYRVDQAELGAGSETGADADG